MTRVLYITPVAERGGQEVVLLHLVRHLDRSRFTPAVVFLQDGPFVKEIEASGIEAVVIEAGRVHQAFRGARAVGAIRRLIADREIDIVHTLNAKAHIYGGLAARLARARTVFHLHGVPRPTISRDGLVSLLAVLTPADQRIACSHYVATAFSQAWPFRPRAQVVHNGITVDRDEAIRGVLQVRADLGIMPDALLFVMACRLQPWKGVHIFLRAAAQVIRICPDARFLVVGGALFGLDEEYGRWVVNEAKALHVDHCVIFTGFRSDVLTLLAAADVVVHASIQGDPFPTVIVEAQTLGRAVVASDIGGPRELIDDGVNGVLVGAGSVDDLSRALITLIQDRELRLALGSAAAAKASAYLRADRMAREFEAAYARLRAPGRVATAR